MNIGVQFSNVQSEDGTFTLDDNFFGGEAQEGDSVVTFDGAAWNLGQADKLGVDLGWIFYPADGGDSERFAALKCQRCDQLYYVPSDPATTPQVLVSGAVAKMGEQSITFEKTAEGDVFPLVNPFPIATTWGDLNTFMKEGDSLYMFDYGNYDLIQYDRLGDGLGWILYPADGSDSERINDESAVILEAGSAAYYMPGDAVTSGETVTWTVTL